MAELRMDFQQMGHFTFNKPLTISEDSNPQESDNQQTPSIQIQANQDGFHHPASQNLSMQPNKSNSRNFEEQKLGASA